jgi:L-ribulose-5-phosphate 4-epimerase
MCEDVARSVHLARQGGPVEALPQAIVDALYDRYQNAYGQNANGQTRSEA